MKNSPKNIQRATGVGIATAAGSAIRVRYRNPRGEVENLIDTSDDFTAKAGITNITTYNFQVRRTNDIFKPNPLIE